MDNKVEQFLLNLPDEKRELALQLMPVFQSCHAQMKESIKWNNLTYSVNGDIAFIYSYKQVPYVNVGFFRGTELDDPKQLLEGTGNTMRHLKIYPGTRIPVAQLKKWIKAHIEINTLHFNNLQDKKRKTK